jgi:hypothetical protein
MKRSNKCFCPPQLPKGRREAMRKVREGEGESCLSDKKKYGEIELPEDE